MSALAVPTDGNQNRAETLNAVAWFEVTISAICVGLRFYSRARITRNLWWDDWVMLFTLGVFCLKHPFSRAVARQEPSESFEKHSCRYALFSPSTRLCFTNLTYIVRIV